MRIFLPLAALALLSGCLDKGSDISIAESYAFATAPSATNGAAFLTIENNGTDDRLVSASADISEKVEIHEMTMEDGVMKMRELTEGVAIPEGTTELTPKGNHIMFMGLKEPLSEGNTFDLTLTFEKAGEMTFPVVISKPGQKPAMEEHDHIHFDGDGHDHGHNH